MGLASLPWIIQASFALEVVSIIFAVFVISYAILHLSRSVRRRTPRAAASDDVELQRHSQPKRSLITLWTLIILGPLFQLVQASSVIEIMKLEGFFSKNETYWGRRSHTNARRCSRPGWVLPNLAKFFNLGVITLLLISILILKRQFFAQTYTPGRKAWSLFGDGLLGVGLVALPALKLGLEIFECYSDGYHVATYEMDLYIPLAFAIWSIITSIAIVASFARRVAHARRAHIEGIERNTLDRFTALTIPILIFVVVLMVVALMISVFPVWMSESGESAFTLIDLIAEKLGIPFLFGVMAWALGKLGDVY